MLLFNRSLIRMSFFVVAIASALGASYASAALVTSGLTTHLRADQGVAIDGSGFVTGWNDQVNSNHATQTTAANRPTLVVSGGHAAVRFDGSDDFLQFITAPSTMGIQSSDYEIFIVAQTTSSTAQFLISGANEKYELQVGSNQSTPGARFIPAVWSGGAGASDIGASQNSYVNNGPHIFSGRVEATNNYYGLINVDGVDSIDWTAADARTSSDTALQLGRRGGSNSLYLNGDIFEVLIYDRSLTWQERQDVGIYLAGKYGLQTSFVPEPSTVALGLFGLAAAMGAAVRRRRRAAAA